ncbi:MAG: HAMP domain-containing histidine kinase [Bacilli bacterium]|nr:HAMP domain-containing histidine kinase [Bacilli bacterium]
MIINYLLTNITYLFFPISLYFIYVAYVKNLDLEEKSIFLELALFSSLYMLCRGVNTNNYMYAVTFLNIPLLISYLKKQLLTSVFISIILVFFLYFNIGISSLVLIVEYGLYFIIFFIYSRQNKMSVERVSSTFVIIRTFFVGFQLTYYILNKRPLTFLISDVIFMTILLLFVSYIALVFFKKCEGVVDYNSTVNELNREKEIKVSLFKITHEIKNPLAVCRGYLDMMIDDDYKNYRKYIPIINSEVNRTLLLMDDFLDYTKLKINKEDVDIVYLIEELENEMKPLLKKNNVEVDFNIPDTEIYMDLDYNRIKQVFVNVIKNSIEAKKDNAVITLDVKEVNDSIEIVIKDNGIGMSSDVLNRIGDTFYTTKERGTGLGVSLSREIIKLHGGNMKYESTLGEGTSVYITLPVN